MEGGRVSSERKRGCCSSSLSSRMAANYRLKRTLLMGKRRGSTTPVPTWKMIGARSNYGKRALSYLNGDNVKDLSLSARKLAAILWETDGMMENGKERRIFDSSMELALSDPFLTTFSEGKLDPTKLCSFRRRSLPTSNLTSSTFIPSCSGKVDEPHNNLKDVYNGLTASKLMFEVLIRVWGVEHLDRTSKSVVSSLRLQLHQSCDFVRRLIRREKRVKNDVVLKQIKHIIHNAVVGELETEKKLKKKIDAELAETKAYLTMAIKGVERERSARRKAEQVCEELAEGIMDMKRQFVKVKEEVEKEREMFHIADLLREERLQMKLYEAKCVYEEQNALVAKLRNELQAYLGGGGDDRSKESGRVMVETLPGSVQKHGKESENNVVVNEDEGEESDESDVESIELSRRFLWGNAVKTGSKMNSLLTCKERKCLPEETRKTTISSKLEQNVMQENPEFYATIRFSEFT